MQVIRDGLAVKILAEPHALIAGCTGSGKSTALDTLLYALASYGASEKAFYIIDFKKISLSEWETLPHCLGYARTGSEATRIVKKLIKEQERRLLRLQRKKQDKTTEGHLYLIIDEGAEFLDICPQLYPDIKSISRLGRAVGIHLIFATQSPNRKTIKADLALNITGRLGLRCSTAIESRQVINATGCELLPRYGKGLWTSPEYMHPLEVDVKLTPEGKIKELVAYQKRHRFGL